MSNLLIFLNFGQTNNFGFLNKFKKVFVLLILRYTGILVNHYVRNFHN